MHPKRKTGLCFVVFLFFFPPPWWMNVLYSLFWRYRFPFFLQRHNEGELVAFSLLHKSCLWDKHLFHFKMTKPPAKRWGHKKMVCLSYCPISCAQTQELGWKVLKTAIFIRCVCTASGAQRSWLVPVASGCKREANGLMKWWSQLGSSWTLILVGRLEYDTPAFALTILMAIRVSLPSVTGMTLKLANFICNFPPWQISAFLALHIWVSSIFLWTERLRQQF